MKLSVMRRQDRQSRQTRSGLLSRQLDGGIPHAGLQTQDQSSQPLSTAVIGEVFSIEVFHEQTRRSAEPWVIEWITDVNRVFLDTNHEHARLQLHNSPAQRKSDFFR